MIIRVKVLLLSVFLSMVCGLLAGFSWCVVWNGKMVDVLVAAVIGLVFGLLLGVVYMCGEIDDLYSDLRIGFVISCISALVLGWLGPVGAIVTVSFAITVKVVRVYRSHK